MKINSPEKPGSHISSYEFIFTPLSILPIGQSASTTTIASHRKYVAQLQRGAQLIHKFSTNIEFDQSFQFQFSEGEAFRLKIYSQKSANFRLVISREESQTLQFAQSFELEIFKAFQRYRAEQRGKGKEYSIIVQKMQQRKEVGAEWKYFKQNCAQHHQNLTACNSTATLQFAYLLDIRSQIDILVECEQPKIKVKPKRSNESERHSSSSANSKSKKNEQNSVSTVQKSLNTCHSELMPQEEQKEDLATKTRSIEDFSAGTLSENTFSKEPSVQPLQLPQQPDSQKPEYPKAACFIPIPSIIKKHENLSDIVEASYEGESVMNSGGEVTDRKWKQMSEIKQEDQAVIMKRKTYHFLNQSEDSPVEIRRNNSLTHFKRPSHQKVDYRQQQAPEDQDSQEQELQPSAFHRAKQLAESSQKVESRNLVMLIILCLVSAAATFFCLSQKQLMRSLSQKQSLRSLPFKQSMRKMRWGKRQIVKCTKKEAKWIEMRIF